MKAWLHDNGKGQDARDTTVHSFLRFTTISVVVAATIIAIGEASRTDNASRDVAPVATRNVPLTVDLARCRDVTAEQLAADNTCRCFWAENRRRFFTSQKAAETR